MKKILLALGIGLFLSILFSSFTDFSRECVDIRDNVLRIHILANSDTDSDQELKLSVRDEILKNSDIIFEQVSDKQSAIQSAKKNTAQIKQIAQDEIIKQGYNYDVDVEIVNMFFDTRVYEDFTLPAGRYDAVRVTIGTAQGANWWCVLYPALCVPVAQPNDALSEVMDNTQIDIITNSNDYKVEFALVELFEKIKNTITK